MHSFNDVPEDYGEHGSEELKQEEDQDEDAVGEGPAGGGGAAGGEAQQPQQAGQATAHCSTVGRGLSNTG